VSLEPRERRVRAYLLAKPMRLVIDLAPAGPEDFAVPSGVTPLAPATSVGSLKTAPIPAPEPTPEAEPETEAAPESVEAPPQGEAQPAPEPAPQASGEPVEGAVESAPEPAPEATPEAEPQTPEAPVAAAEPEVTAPEHAPAAESPPEPAPEPLPPETGFPWLLALGALVAAASVGGLGLWLWRHSAEPQLVTRSPAGRPKPLGAEGISSDELRFAADATVVLEQRLDQEVRARVALEERLGEASEELKVLRDRLSRIERRREEAR